MWLAAVKLLGGVRATAFALALLAALGALGVQSWRLNGAGEELATLRAEIRAQKIAAQVVADLKTAEVAELAARLEEQSNEANAELDRVLADLAGERRLRSRFRCPTAAPETPGAPAGSDGAGEGGLSHADATVLVRFAAECDAVARRLTGAQDYIRAIQR